MNYVLFSSLLRGISIVLLLLHRNTIERVIEKIDYSSRFQISVNCRDEFIKPK